MKILFVAPWIPASVRPRSLVILEMLAAEHDVRFLGLVHDEEEARLAELLPVKERTLVPNPRVGSMLRSARALGTGVSLQTGYASPKALTDALRRELDDFQPDVVHLNVFRTVHLVEACGSTPVIVDLDEFRSEYYEQLASHGPSPAWRALGRVEAPRMRAREDKLVGMGVPLMLSAPSLPGQERPNTFLVRSPCDFSVQRQAGPIAPTVLFVGRLSYEANVNGLMWFARECWQGIRDAVPDARLRIVGTDPPKAVQELVGNGIELHANAPAVEPHYTDAAVAIAPIFRGTGVQLKLIQAMSAGVPSVTTSMVADRAGVADGVHVRVADDRAGWIAAVSGLLSAPETAARLAANGREWVAAHHSSAAVRLQLQAAYASLSTGAQMDGASGR
ncbi:Glycosyltransferase involved in cell wall bisynthesis [Micromonospora echinofusca]|uniref:Glycosyltransferase involved in cell wall bisynthesis n=1 Tax=Micromonospora echinofusca TaxID=47858 RepID=A0A1C5GE38_MICEH|nr:glycosyltransferase family 4 protein [Micromonospora echinofusca]SCG18105.1 Glycosyltransferase involved in cell wall bisynthesis [Micromonospora echinofusca]